MKEKLINRLFTEFEHDKDIIKENLLKVIDAISLYTSDDYGKLTLTIKYEKNIEGEKELWIF